MAPTLGLLLCAVLAAPARAAAPDPSTPEQALARVFSGAPMTPPAPAASSDEVELGRMLFFDPRLSSNGTVSCSKCHNPGLAWRDGLPRARGLTQQELKRRAPSLLNASRTELFFWDGRASSFGQAALAAIENPDEMNRPLKDVVRDLSAIPGYAAQFRRAYGDGAVVPARIGSALEAFVRAATRLPPSPFDRFAAGDRTALSPAAGRGLIVFAGKGRCQRCHSGASFSDGFFHNTGVKTGPEGEDPGRYAVTPFHRARRAFKTVPLRNVAATAPYMHNGSLKTLADVVDFYNRGGDEADERDFEMKPLNLAPGEKDDLVAFLESLTNPPVPVAVPILPGDEAAEAAPPPLAPERALDRARERVAAAERVLDGASGPAPKRSCREDFTLEKAIAAYNAGKVPAEIAADGNKGQGVLEDILFNRIYRVALTGDMALCDSMKMPIVYAGISNPGSFWCRDLYLDAAAALTLTKRSPAFAGVCRQWLVVSYPKIAPAEADEACGIIRAHVDHPKALCSLLIPRWVAEENRPGCEAEYGRYTRFADPNVCDPVKGGPDSLVLRCDDYARLARADKAGDPKLCGDSEICRLLTGTGAELPGVYEEKVRAAFCGATAAEADAAGLSARERAASLLGGAEDDLAAAESGRAQGDHAAARRIDAVAERASRVKLRFY